MTPGCGQGQDLYRGALELLLYTKYINSGPHGFRRRFFKKFFLLKVYGIY